ncbi:MAG: hypothetical protein CL916_07080 [Deltaproteobacteria bacterium]|nr:hypothetical protein [Deltaproteobacteria bacterium]
MRSANAAEIPVSEGSTFIEKRFAITQPSKIGYIVESILRTVDRLGIDIKLVAMRFGPLHDGEWIVEYGSAIGDHKNNYTYQNPKKALIGLHKQRTGVWRDVDCRYTLTASVKFLGIKVSLGPVYAYQADITFDFTSEKHPIYVYGDALFPASQAQALDFMTDLQIAKVNALFIAGLRCADICSVDVCSKNKHTLPKTGLDVIQCNPDVQPIGVKDFGNGPEEYYHLRLEFYLENIAMLSEPSK